MKKVIMYNTATVPAFVLINIHEWSQLNAHVSLWFGMTCGNLLLYHCFSEVAPTVKSCYFSLVADRDTWFLALAKHSTLLRITWDEMAWDSCNLPMAQFISLLCGPHHCNIWAPHKYEWFIPPTPCDVDQCYHPHFSDGELRQNSMQWTSTGWT